MDSLLQLPWFLIFSSLAKTIFLIFLVVLPMVSYTVYAERRDCRNHRETRRDPEVELVYVSRDEVFLEQELDGVCHWLTESAEP